LRAKLYPLGERLVQRAREAGRLRADCGAEDIAILQPMLGLVIGAAQDVEPELWRRYLGIVLQGVRANPGPPAPLEPPPSRPSGWTRCSSPPETPGGAADASSATSHRSPHS
jgi:hypothetical protein